MKKLASLALAVLLFSLAAVPAWAVPTTVPVTLTFTLDSTPAPAGTLIELVPDDSALKTLNATTDGAGEVVFAASEVEIDSDYTVFIDKIPCTVPYYASSSYTSYDMDYEVYLVKLQLNGGAVKGDYTSYWVSDGRGLPQQMVFPQKAGSFFEQWTEADGTTPFRAYSAGQTAYAKWQTAILTDFTILGIPAQYGVQQKDKEMPPLNVDVMVPFGTDLSALVANFTISAGGSVDAYVGPDGEAVPQISGVSANDFTDGKEVFYQARNGSYLQNYIVRVSSDEEKLPGEDNTPSNNGERYSLVRVKATTEGNGTIAPTNATDGYLLLVVGEDQTFTITPGNGSTLIDLLVDGKSVGAMGEYTFKDLQKDHTIHAVFSGPTPVAPLKPHPDTGR